MKTQMKLHPRLSRNRTLKYMTVSLLVTVLGIGLAFSRGPVFFSENAAAQGANNSKISPEALRQMEALVREKESRTPAQQKIDSQLLYKLKWNRGELRLQRLEHTAAAVQEDAQGMVLLDLRAQVTPNLLESIRKLGGDILSAHEGFNAVRARLPLEALESLAGLDEVKFIRPAEEMMTNGHPRRAAAPKLTRAERAARLREQLRRALPFVAGQKTSANLSAFNSAKRLFPALTGSVNSEGDAAHRADQVRALGINGNGVRIGVLSDSVRFLAASQASGDLPAGVTVLAGQSGVDTVNMPPTDTGEGTAMLEIINDLAPGAQLFFATANGGQANMAANILALAGVPNNCDIIVDDVTYFSEAVFQDGTVAQAVNTVTAAGVLYFSSAGNSGNFNDGTSGVWEGDFADGGMLAAVPGGRVHDFGGGVIANTINATGGGARPITLKWSDPLGASGNDYDLFILNAALTTVIASSTNSQSGSQDPLESIANNAMTPVFAAGNRIVILRRTGAATRALH